MNGSRWYTGVVQGPWSGVGLCRTKAAKCLQMASCADGNADRTGDPGSKMENRRVDISMTTINCKILFNRGLAYSQS